MARADWINLTVSRKPESRQSFYKRMHKFDKAIFLATDVVKEKLSDKKVK